MRRRREIDNKIFGDNLRFYRRMKGLSVEDVKEYLCLGSVQAIYKWEGGKCFPQADTLIALTELYEVELKDLTGEKWWCRKVDFVYHYFQPPQGSDSIFFTISRSTKADRLHYLQEYLDDYLALRA